MIAFHPGHPERGCHVFNAENGARNREGWTFGELLVLAPEHGEMPQYGASPFDDALTARKKADAAVAQEFRAIIRSEVRVSVTRDSRGTSTRLESGVSSPLAERTALPLKKQRDEKRREDADKYAARAANAKTEEARLLAKIQMQERAAQASLGIYPPEIA